MKSLITLCIASVATMILLGSSGCVSRADYDRCVNRNQIQMERIARLESAQEAEKLKTEQLRQQYQLNSQKEGYWQQQTQALQAALDAKNAELDRLAQLVGKGQVTLPPELSNELAEWARQSGSDLVSYDEQSGIVRFKSDLLFAKGQDTVAPAAAEKLTALAKIMNSPAAQNLDMLIVGHTDDIPIKKPATLARHPNNWYLSAHRAIAVESVLAHAGIAEKRLAVMGMGALRPIAPNAPHHKGNPKNRRVEIYIVPAGQIHLTMPRPDVEKP